MKKSLKNGLTISIVIIIVTILYLVLICYLKKYFITNIARNETFKNNEFGDFIGGVLNPLFTLLSTVSIIFLTYILAKGENIKAEKAIETQKRITLNQMRQTTLENLIQKTNLYVYEIDNISVHSVENKMQQILLTNMIKNGEKNQEKVMVWLIILSELENFAQLKYLFSDLFQKNHFKEKYDAIIDVTGKLYTEHQEMKFVNSKTLEKYVNIQQEFLTIIGSYIYSEF